MDGAKPISQGRATPSALEDVVFGALSGVAGKVVEFPFDTVKVRLQTQPLTASGAGLLYRGPLDCIVRATRTDGVLSLYRGLPVPLVGSMVEYAVLFASYTRAQDLVRAAWSIPQSQPLALHQLCLAGALSGLCVSFFLTPIELVKCRLQVRAADFAPQKGREPAVRQGAFDIVRNALRQEGLRGMYKGHVGTMLREFCGTSVWFGTYEFVCSAFLSRKHGTKDAKDKTKDDLSPWQLVVAGAAAGMMFNSTTFPADVVKSRQQTQIDGSLSFLRTASLLLRSEGPRGFFRGWLITVLRSAPTSGVMFASYEMLVRSCTGILP